LACNAAERRRRRSKSVGALLPQPVANARRAAAGKMTSA